MAANRRKKKKDRNSTQSVDKSAKMPEENPSSDALTVAWVTAVIAVVLCDLGAAAAYGWIAWRGVVDRVFVLAELLVAAGAIVGIVALAIIPFLYRVRRTPPPTGVTVFAVCAAVAPLLAITARMLR